MLQHSCLASAVSCRRHALEMPPYHSTQASYSFIDFCSARSFHTSWVSLLFIFLIIQQLVQMSSNTASFFCMWKEKLHYRSQKKKTKKNIYIF